MSRAEAILFQRKSSRLAAAMVVADKINPVIDVPEAVGIDPALDGFLRFRGAMVNSCAERVLARNRLFQSSYGVLGGYPRGVCKIFKIFSAFFRFLGLI